MRHEKERRVPHSVALNTMHFGFGEDTVGNGAVNEEFRRVAVFSARTGCVREDDDIQRFLCGYHHSSLRKVAYLMQFGIPIRVHVLFFTNNIRGHPFKVVRLTVFLFPLKDASVELLHLKCNHFQFHKATKCRFVEMIHATPRFLPCEVWKQAISAGIMGS